MLTICPALGTRVTDAMIRPLSGQMIESWDSRELLQKQTLDQQYALRPQPDPFLQYIVPGPKYEVDR